MIGIFRSPYSFVKPEDMMARRLPMPASYMMPGGLPANLLQNNDVQKLLQQRMRMQPGLLSLLGGNPQMTAGVGPGALLSLLGAI